MNREQQVNDLTYRSDFHVGSGYNRHDACLSTWTERVAPPVFFYWMRERSIQRSC